MCRKAFAAQVSFEQLLQQGFAPVKWPDAPFAQGGFPTPSGRCELASERLATRGLDPVPDHVPNHEAVGTSERYPLAMISPPARNFLNSSFVNVPSLQALEREPILEMHADDAGQRGIRNGDVVRVFNDRGSYHCKAVISPRARSGVT